MCSSVKRLEGTVSMTDMFSLIFSLQLSHALGLKVSPRYPDRSHFVWNGPLPSVSSIMLPESLQTGTVSAPLRIFSTLHRAWCMGGSQKHLGLAGQSYSHSGRVCISLVKEETGQLSSSLGLFQNGLYPGR